MTQFLEVFSLLSRGFKNGDIMEVLYRESIPRRPGTKNPKIYKISEFPEFREIFLQIPNIPGFPGTITSYIKAIRITSFLSKLIFFSNWNKANF